MKTRPFSLLNISALIILGIVSSTPALYSAPADKPAADSARAQTNAVPQSVYAVPSKGTEGRDPFFPKSTRLIPKVIVKTTKTDVPAVTLVLNGIGGGFAMINGRTMAAGEESDVNTSNGGRAHIRLIEIKEKDSAVLVEINGQTQQELHLRPGSQ